MSELLPVVFTVVLVILTIVLSVVGIQMIMVLAEVRRTLKKVNTTIEQAETKINAIINPFQNLGGFTNAVQVGTQAFEKIIDWLDKKKSKKSKSK